MVMDSASSPTHSAPDHRDIKRTFVERNLLGVWEAAVIAGERSILDGDANRLTDSLYLYIILTFIHFIHLYFVPYEM